MSAARTRAPRVCAMRTRARERRSRRLALASPRCPPAGAPWPRSRFATPRARGALASDARARRARSMSPQCSQVALGLECGHAPRARCSDSLPEDPILHVSGGEYPGNAGLRRTRDCLDVRVGVELELPDEQL